MSCPRCGGATRLVPEYNQHWCDACKAYASVAEAGRKKPNYWLIIGLPVGLVAVALGVLLYMSVSSFKSYVKKGKSSEAQMNLREIAHGARFYYENEHYGSGTKVMTNVLPGPVGPTPPLGSCCEEGGKCDPRAERWSHPVWQALNFSIDWGAHYFSYEFRPSGDGQSFTVAAYGDLDCDGVYSTYELYGQPDGSGSIEVSTHSMFIENELE